MPSSEARNSAGLICSSISLMSTPLRSSRAVTSRFTSFLKGSLRIPGSKCSKAFL